MAIGQTEEWPVDFPNTQNGTALRRMAFAADGPHDGWDGGLSGFYDDIFVAAADVDSDIDTGLPAAATDNVVFTLPSGRFTLEFWLGTENDSGDQELGIGLFKITSGLDDAQLILSIGFAADVVSTVTEESEASGYIKRTFVADHGAQYYVGALGLASDSIDTRHYMQITKVQ